MSQPPYGAEPPEPDRPGEQPSPGAYPPPVDPFNTMAGQTPPADHPAPSSGPPAPPPPPPPTDPPPAFSYPVSPASPYAPPPPTPPSGYPQQPTSPAGYPQPGSYTPPGGYPQTQPQPSQGDSWPPPAGPTTPQYAPGYATPGSPAPGYPSVGSPTSGYPAPPQAYPGQPTYPGQPVYDPTSAYQPYPGAPGPVMVPPKKRRGLMITLIALGLAVLLCGGGGIAAWLLLGEADGQGADDPTKAVETFLTAVYTEQDIEAASRITCADARNRDDISRKIDEIKEYSDQYKDPKFTWTAPAVSDQGSERATVDVKLRVTTQDEKVAEQQLQFTVIKSTGWFVCEVQSGR